jgi:hypothetical protein
VFEHNIVTKNYFPIEINDWGNRIDYNLFADEVALHDAQKNGTDKNSVAGDALFVNPQAGDYSVVQNSPALKVRFKNFPMDEFGVQKPALKKIAQHAPIPVLTGITSSQNKSALISFLGGTIKSVEGLGERSAYGLPSEEGVIIVSAGNNSLLSKSGLLDKDVIIEADGKSVKDIKVLMDIYQSSSWKGKIPISILRNQQLLKVLLLLK